MMDVWSRKVVAWDVESSEDPKLAASLIGRAYLRERITRRRKQPLILHADNGNAMRAVTLEVRLEELGVDPSPGHGSQMITLTQSRCSAPLNTGLIIRARHSLARSKPAFLVLDFVDCYNHRHRHSGVKFVTPHQRHNGEAEKICEHRGRVYEQARELYPRRWSRSTRSWRQPGVVWINPFSHPADTETARLAVAA